MKIKTIFRATAIVMALFPLAISMTAQVEGNGNVIIQERETGDFGGVDVRSGIDVHLRQTGVAGLEIEADENLQDYIISEVKNNVLHVYVRPNTNIRRSHAMAAYITVSELSTISVSGGGDVEAKTPIKSDEMAISISGGGDLEMELIAGETTCSVSGGGDVQLSGEMGKFAASISGGGDLQLDAGLGDVSISMSGGGDATINGDRATTVAISLSGGGDLDMDAQCGTLAVNVSGGGDCEISAGDGGEKAAISSTGGGDLDLNIGVEELAVSVGGGGDATLNGSAGNMDIEIKSGGDLSAAGFRAENAVLRLSGGSDARIHVDGNLNVEAAGGAQVYVTGDPRIVSKLTGGSEVHTR